MTFYPFKIKLNGVFKNKNANQLLIQKECTEENNEHIYSHVL